MNEDDAIISSLRQLAAAELEPQAFVSLVHTRISEMPEPRRIRRKRRARKVFAVVVAGALAALPGPRTAVARFLGIGSVRIEQQQGPTTATLPASLRKTNLGTRVTSTEASRALGRSMATVRGITPTAIFVQPTTATPQLILVNSVYVSSSFGVDAVLVSELPGPGNIYVAKKLATAASKLDFFSVRGHEAVWVSGAPHEVAMLTTDGKLEKGTVRLAGNVLLWADNTRTIRIEGFRDQSAAIQFLERLEW